MLERWSLLCVPSPKCHILLKIAVVSSSCCFPLWCYLFPPSAADLIRMLLGSGLEEYTTSRPTGSPVAVPVP